MEIQSCRNSQFLKLNLIKSDEQKMPITYIMSKKDMTTLSSKQVKLEKERIDYGEFLLHNHNEKFKMNPITYQEGLEIVRVIKDELKLRELKLAREKGTTPQYSK